VYRALTHSLQQRSFVIQKSRSYNSYILKFIQMKILFNFVLLSLTINLAQAQTPNTVSGKIERVTVFRQSAKLNGTATASAPSGNSEIVITDLTDNAVQQSLQVKLGSAQVHLLSATFRVNYLKINTATARLKTLRDSVEMLIAERNSIMDQTHVNAEEIAIIKKTAEERLGGTEKGASFEDLKNVADFYQKRLTELNIAQRKLAKKNTDLSTLQDKYQNTINDLDGKSTKPVGEIVLKIDADAATTFPIEFSILTNAASWTPIYDLKATEGKPLQLVYKANIQQSSGYEWKDVQLLVSSGNPNVDNTLPKLEARYVDFMQPAVFYGNQSKNAAPSAPAKLQEQQIQRGNNDNNNIAAYDLNSSLGGSYNLNIPPPPPNASDAGSTIEMEITRKQTIPTDGQMHLLEVNKHEIPVTYEYQTVPRKEHAAFLLAKITDFGQYNLVAGTANLFFNETYVGQSDINPSVTSDTLYFSMGRDEKVVIKRAKLKDVTATKLFSNTKKETVGYETVIRNNKAVAIDLEILDNIPLSRQKDITVEIDEKTGGELFPDYGEVVWNLHLNPGETKKITLIYTIKYPKTQNVTFGLQSEQARGNNSNRAMKKR
jgi:uncharacterized protein (TIGR02231 family)